MTKNKKIIIAAAVSAAAIVIIVLVYFLFIKISIVGTWKETSWIKRGKLENISSDEAISYTFKEDGTYSTSNGDSGYYTIKDNNLYFGDKPGESTSGEFFRITKLTHSELELSFEGDTFCFKKT